MSTNERALREALEVISRRSLVGPPAPPNPKAPPSPWYNLVIELGQVARAALARAEGEPQQVAVAPTIPGEHWLNDPLYDWLRRGYEYATTQTLAIKALASTTPGRMAHAVMAVMRGAGIILPHEHAAPAPDASPVDEPPVGPWRLYDDRGGNCCITNGETGAKHCFDSHGEAVAVREALNWVAQEEGR